MPEPSKRTLLGLDVVNIFMVDVRDGVGVYLSVYLLTAHNWDPFHIGMVIAIPGIVGIIMQAPMPGMVMTIIPKLELMGESSSE